MMDDYRSHAAASLADLGALADEISQHQFDEAYLVGMAVALVKDGEIVTRGYGHDDLAANRVVDPQRTLFRMGSNSKLFTAIAVLQLVERGLLDLDADINDYLSGRPIPAAFGRPVTLKHLLTHTAGFEVNELGYTVASDINDDTPLLEILLRHQPARVRPPAVTFTEGERAAYSNWGIALAGCIVAEVAGQPFNDYVVQHIFTPLQMTRSSFREPLPADLAADMSLGYSGDEDYAPAHFKPLKNLGPAGSLSSTVADMANFLQMQLDQGRFNGQAVLQPESVALMQSRVFNPHPQVNGLGLVWMEQHINGRRLLTHGGRTPLFYVDLHLLPEENLGVLVAYNTNPPGDYNGALMREIMDRFYPAEPPPISSIAPDPGRARALAGHYLATTTSHTTWEKVLGLGMSLKVSANDAGHLLIPEPGEDEPTEWAEVTDTPGVFRRVDRDDTIAFKRDETGRTWLLGLGAPTPARRLSLPERPFPNLFLVSQCAVLFLAGIALSLLLTPVAAPLKPLAVTLAAINIATLMTLLATLSRDPDSMLAKLPWTLYATKTLGLASLVTTTAFAAQLTTAWTSGLLGAPHKILYGLTLITGVTFLGWLQQWRLLGFRLARRLRYRRTKREAILPNVGGTSEAATP